MRGKERQRSFNVRYYQAHQREEIARVRSRQEATVRFLRDLRSQCCADCGQSFAPWVMDFDHRNPEEKSFAITTGRSLLMNRDRLLAEIAKCDVVCANCHAVRTYAQLLEKKDRLPTEEWAPGKSRYIAKKRAAWHANAKMLSELRNVPCADCGRRFPPYVMQFDHLNGAVKQFTVTRIINRSRKLILEEVSKCDIVCANCHRQRTYQRRTAARGSSSAWSERDPSKVDVRGSNPLSRSSVMSQDIANTCLGTLWTGVGAPK